MYKYFTFDNSKYRIKEVKMNFQTPVDIAKYDFTLCHKDKIFMAGSCFADSIAQKMKDVKMTVANNPFGVLYNPLSISRCFEILETEHKFGDEDLIFDNGLWFSFDLHTSFSGIDKDIVLQRANDAVTYYAKKFEESNIVIITLGTAWLYRHIETEKVVCNCHKIAAKKFNRYLLETSEIEEVLGSLIKKYNNKRFIFTLSPVRHTKDGLAENSLSKAILRVAIDKITRRFDNAVYFPSFEIMNDELRDYRFYARDMIHPNEVAVDYIWEKFSQSFFDNRTIDLMAKAARIKAAAEHRPFNPDSEEHHRFKLSQLREIEKLSEFGLDFTNEIKYFSNNE